MRVSGSQLPAERLRREYEYSTAVFSMSLDATNYIPAGAMAAGERLETGGVIVPGQIKFVFRGV